MEFSIDQAGIEVPPALAQIEVGSLYAQLQGLWDGRAARGRRYEAALVVTLMLVAKLAGETSLSGIAEWVRLRAALWQACLPLRRLTLPCANTYRYVCEHLDVAQLNALLATALCDQPPEAAGQEPDAHGAEAPPEVRHLALDGKRLRGTRRAGARARAAREVVGLYDVTQRLMVRQAALPGAGQEMATATQVLAEVDLSGCVVSADAYYTHRTWCEHVLAQGGDYLLVAKANQPDLAEAIAVLFSDAPRPWLPHQQLQQVEKRHGRLTRRHLRVSDQLNAYLAPSWPAVAQVFQLERTVTRHGQRHHERVLGLTSLAPHVAPPARLLTLLRQHWHIENRVHWRRDVTLAEDRSTVCSGQVPLVVASLNNAVLALMDRLNVTNMAAQMRIFAARPRDALHLLIAPL